MTSRKPQLKQGDHLFLTTVTPRTHKTVVSGFEIVSKPELEDYREGKPCYGVLLKRLSPS